MEIISLKGTEKQDYFDNLLQSFVGHFTEITTVLIMLQMCKRKCLFGLILGCIFIIFLLLKLIKNGQFIHKALTASITNRSEDRKVMTVLANHFVTCPDPLGRLGNMMFQIAATISIARAVKYTPVISDHHPLTKMFSLSNVVKLSKPKLQNVTVIHEDEWKDGQWIEAHPDYIKHNLTTGGYLHFWKMVNKSAGEIKEALTIKPEFLNKAKSFLKENIPASTVLIGIHVRRGDFTKAKGQKMGRVVADAKYITKAMNYYRNRINNAYFVVCSDDMKWCKKSINGSDVVYSNFTAPILDMAILSLCDHIIITAGSFGWWGGWLSAGTVVYLSDFPRPGSWLDNNGTFRETYYPPDWIGMSNGD